MDIQAQESQGSINRRVAIRRLLGLEGERGRFKFSDTLKLSLAVSGSLVLSYPTVSQIAEEAGVKIGNRGSEERDKLKQRDFGETLWKGSVVASYREETTYRALPTMVLELLRQRGNQLKVGFPISLIFAAGHNFYTNAKGESQFATDTVPLYQTIGGLYLWKVARDRGWLHSLVAHSVHNAIADTAALFPYWSNSSAAKKS